MTPDLKNRPKLARWVLIISLGLNLAVIGLVIGAVIAGPPDRRQPALPGLTNFSVLPEPYRSNLGSEMRHGRRDWSKRREELKAQREAMAAALTADPFDPEAFRNILNEEQNLMQDITRRGTDLLMQQIELMSVEERETYAKALMTAQKRPPRDKRPH